MVFGFVQSSISLRFTEFQFREWIVELLPSGWPLGKLFVSQQTLIERFTNYLFIHLVANKDQLGSPISIDPQNPSAPIESAVRPLITLLTKKTVVSQRLIAFVVDIVREFPPGDV